MSDENEVSEDTDRRQLQRRKGRDRRGFFMSEPDENERRKLPTRRAATFIPSLKVVS